MRRRSLVPFSGGRFFRASRYGLGRRVGCCGEGSSVDRRSRRGRRGRGTGCDRGDRRGARRIHIGHEGGEEAISKRGGVGSLKRQAVCQAKNVARAVQKRNEGARTGYTHAAGGSKGRAPIARGQSHTFPVRVEIVKESEPARRSRVVIARKFGSGSQLPSETAIPRRDTRARYDCFLHPRPRSCTELSTVTSRRKHGDRNGPDFRRTHIVPCSVLAHRLRPHPDCAHTPIAPIPRLRPYPESESRV